MFERVKHLQCAFLFIKDKEIIRLFNNGIFVMEIVKRSELFEVYIRGEKYSPG
ncbi:hypothetical protein AABM38_04045 [Heyndrickxia sp. MSNUG]|uniref:hypothetical protein n=1 Tax=Heyndrickxia sp. MSNUG TaxID=3136677 RepID=UPI003C2EF090